MRSLYIQKVNNLSNNRIREILIANLKYQPYFKVGLLTQLNADRYLKESIRSYIRGNSHIYIIGQDNVLIGFGALKMLDWDSKILKSNLAKIEALFLNNISKGIAKTTILSKVINKAISKGVDYLTIRLNKENKSTIAAIKSNDFQQDEQLYNMFLKLDNFRPFSNKNNVVREFNKIDIKTIKSIAYYGYKNRFSAEKKFHEKYVKNLFSNWAHNCCCGRSDKVYVIEKKGIVVGFIAYNNIDQLKQIFGKKIALIDLFVVDERFRGEGLGYKLLSDSLEQVRDNYDLIELNVADTVIAAIKAYKKAGFKKYDSLLTFHKWL